MATVFDKGNSVLTALMTPPYNLTLYSTDNEMRPEALDCLIAGLRQENIPSVMSDKVQALALSIHCHIFEEKVMQIQSWLS